MTRILLLILVFFLAYTAYTALMRLMRKSDTLPPEKTPQGEDMVKDPHCGVFLPRGDALERRVGGKRYYFCSEECRNKFEENSDKQ